MEHVTKFLLKRLYYWLYYGLWNSKLDHKLFSATVKQMFGGSSQLPTTAEHCLIVWTVLNDFIAARLAEVGGWEKNIWLTVAKNDFVGWALNFRIRLLLKRAVKKNTFTSYKK